MTDSTMVATSLLKSRSVKSRTCPRCSGYLLRDLWELVCLNCGYRSNLNLEAEAREYEAFLKYFY